MTINPKERAVSMKFLELLQVDGIQANRVLTESQIVLFHSLLYRKYNRQIVVSATQYGKSLITALAAVVITCIQGKTIAIVAPTNEKAKIIMRYYIQHLGDNALFHSQLEARTRLDRLRREESKERITLKNGGGIFIISVQSVNSKRTIEAAMGMGAEIVLQDESCLIPDDTEATVFRMIAGKKNAFYCKIGNPFYKQHPYTHFFKSWNNPDYHKIFIDYKTGLKEGRYTEEFIEEARKKPHFGVLFECQFPEEDIMDGVWMQLLTTDEIETAMEDVPMFGEKALGIDPSNGKVDASVIVERSANAAKILFYSNNLELLAFAGYVGHIMEETKPVNTFVDGVGMGVGLVQYLRDNGIVVNDVNMGQRALDEKNYINRRAEAYWRLRNWIKSGGKLYPDERWHELSNIRYKPHKVSGKLQIMPKEVMATKGIPSPNVSDALALSFADPVKTYRVSHETSVHSRLMDSIKRRKKQKVLYRV